MAVASSIEKRDSRGTNQPASMDPQALMRIKNLTLRAKTVVEGFYHGLHRSPFHGNSIEFREYRPYSHGDDLRNLDWKLYARTDRYYIKKFEDETNRQCTLIQDQSRSMAYGSLDYTKSQYASTVLATLAYFLHSQRDSVGLLTFDEIIKEYQPPSRNHGQLRRLMAMLSGEPSGNETDMQRPLQEVAALAKRRGLIILASDFLTPIESIQPGLSFLRARGQQVLLIRILDPVEIDFSIRSPSMVRDMETDDQIYIDPAVVKEDYIQAFNKHRDSLQTVCQGMGVDLFEMSTSDSIERALHELVTLQSSKKHSSRPRSPGGRDNRPQSASDLSPPNSSTRNDTAAATERQKTTDGLGNQESGGHP